MPAVHQQLVRSIALPFPPELGAVQFHRHICLQRRSGPSRMRKATQDTLHSHGDQMVFRELAGPGVRLVAGVIFAAAGGGHRRHGATVSSRPSRACIHSAGTAGPGACCGDQRAGRVCGRSLLLGVFRAPGRLAANPAMTSFPRFLPSASPLRARWDASARPHAAKGHRASLGGQQGCLCAWARPQASVVWPPGGCPHVHTLPLGSVEGPRPAVEVLLTPWGPMGKPAGVPSICSPAIRIFSPERWQLLPA